jgi:hypothetical protein
LPKGKSKAKYPSTIHIKQPLGKRLLQTTDAGVLDKISLSNPTITTYSQNNHNHTPEISIHHQANDHSPTNPKEKKHTQKSTKVQYLKRAS